MHVREILKLHYQGLRSSSFPMGVSSGYSGMVGKPNTHSKVEPKYPALLFKQHLTAYLEKIYGMIRDSLKKEISPFLNLCIQVSILHKRYMKKNFTVLKKTTELAPDHNNTFKNAICRHPDPQGPDQ